MTSFLKAMDVIVKYQHNSPPIQVVSIATELGINVYTVKEWPNDLSGKLQKDEGSKSGFSIYVNAKHPDVRKRFTIAHEIAHYILHQDKIGDGIVEDALYRSGLSNADETAANSMAADILMPWHLINKAINSGINSVEELAAKFNVSNSSMSIRLGMPYEYK